MFSFLGIDKGQVQRLQDEFSIYIVGSSRISLAAIAPDNVDYSGAINRQRLSGLSLGVGLGTERCPSQLSRAYDDAIGVGVEVVATLNCSPPKTGRYPVSLRYRDVFARAGA